MKSLNAENCSYFPQSRSSSSRNRLATRASTTASKAPQPQIKRQTCSSANKERLRKTNASTTSRRSARRISLGGSEGILFNEVISMTIS